VRRVVLLSVAALLGFPAAASAANQTVQADDATLSWSPVSVAVMPGESVTWTFTGTSQAHNVASNSANWTLSTPIQSNHAPVTYTFPATGDYAFICQVHSGMTGTVYVNADGTVPGTPPPPPSEQPFPNDQSPPGTLEVADTSRPKLTRVHASRIARGVRVRFHLSEPGRVTVRVRRGDHVVRARTLRLRRAATRTLQLRGLLAGSYRVEVSARDSALNRSRVKRARVSVR
jgi:plastocyanin